jgi:hypothetical protein
MLPSNVSPSWTSWSSRTKMLGWESSSCTKSDRETPPRNGRQPIIDFESGSFACEFSRIIRRFADGQHFEFFLGRDTECGNMNNLHNFNIVHSRCMTWKGLINSRSRWPWAWFLFRCMNWSRPCKIRLMRATNNKSKSFIRDVPYFWNNSTFVWSTVSVSLLFAHSYNHNLITIPIRTRLRVSSEGRNLLFFEAIGFGKASVHDP